MKKQTIALMCLSLCAPAALSQAQEPAAPAPQPAAEAPAAKPSPEEIKEMVSYFLGYQTGIQFANFGEGPLQIDDIDKDIFYKAIADGLSNRVDPEMEKRDLQGCITAYLEMLAARSKALSDANIAKSKAFFEENGKKEGVVTTPSGLQYKVITPSDQRTYNAEKDGANAEASITYEGRLLDGTVFDQANDPITLPITGVIPGFAEALKLMPIGAEWEIYIPSELGYGEQGPGILGSNAALIFKLKLHDIQPGKAPAGPPVMTPEIMRQLQEQGLQPIQ